VHTYKVILLPEALSDLEAIHAYIAQDSSDNAAGMAARILDAIEGLATMPGRFAPARTRRRLDYDLRVVVVRPYKVFYSIEGQAVYIRTIRHGARRPWP
jgi:plasmid stabilization system protein ParE